MRFLGENFISLHNELISCYCRCSLTNANLFTIDILLTVLWLPVSFDRDGPYPTRLEVKVVDLCDINSVLL
jgi:hypothetical protein